jgi:hypothetical protein
MTEKSGAGTDCLRLLQLSPVNHLLASAPYPHSYIHYGRLIPNFFFRAKETAFDVAYVYLRIHSKVYS